MPPPIWRAMPARRAPDRSQGYVWPIYPAYEIFSANLDGSKLTPLTKNPGYDAEGTISPDGKKIVFTSMRSGDLDIYTMNADGSGTKRLTSEKGYDGGPFFSWDGKTIVYRAYHPKTKEELKEYESLLAQEPDQADESGDLHDVRRWVQQAASNP